VKSATAKSRYAKACFSELLETFEPNLEAREEIVMATRAMIKGRCQSTSFQLPLRKRKATLELRKMIKSEVPVAFASGVL
jgi:hypothetical protein